MVCTRFFSGRFLFLRFFSVLKDSSWQPDKAQYVRKKLDFTILDNVGFGGLRNAVSLNCWIKFSIYSLLQLGSIEVPSFLRRDAYSLPAPNRYALDQPYSLTVRLGFWKNQSANWVSFNLWWIHGTMGIFFLPGGQTQGGSREGNLQL